MQLDNSNHLSTNSKNESFSLTRNEEGKLPPADLVDLNARIESSASTIFDQSNSSENYAPIPPISRKLEQALVSKIGAISEQNLDIQRNKLITGAQKGELNLADMKASVLSFPEIMRILLEEAPQNADGSRELMIKGILDKNGASGEMKLRIQEAAIQDSDGHLLTQIIDPIYREILLSHSEQKFYNFEFFDTKRASQIQKELDGLQNEKKSITDVGGMISDFFYGEISLEEFNQQLSSDLRLLFGIDPDPLDESGIGELYSRQQEMDFMIEPRKDSIITEFNKATISGRFCQDGSIGELKSVNIHSAELGGAQLMNFWNDFCDYIHPNHVYLEDDAKIESQSGSYNLRLFRLMTTEDKVSWYADSYGYCPYIKEEMGEVSDRVNPNLFVQESIQPLKEMSLTHAIELIQKEGITVDSGLLPLLERYNLSFLEDMTLGNLVKHIGSRIKQGEELHKEIDQIFTLIKGLSEYTGSKEEILALKEKAEFVANDRFYRKRLNNRI